MCISLCGSSSKSPKASCHTASIFFNAQIRVVLFYLLHCRFCAVSGPSARSRRFTSRSTCSETASLYPVHVAHVRPRKPHAYAGDHAPQRRTSKEQRLNVSEPQHGIRFALLVCGRNCNASGSCSWRQDRTLRTCKGKEDVLQTHRCLALEGLMAGEHALGLGLKG